MRRCCCCSHQRYTERTDPSDGNINQCQFILIIADPINIEGADGGFEAV